jgi:hypothetical protein
MTELHRAGRGPMSRGPMSRGPMSEETTHAVTPSRRHDALLASYLLGLRHGPAAVRDLIVADLDGFLDLGAERRAADQLVVLHAFLARYPEAARDVRAADA